MRVTLFALVLVWSAVCVVVGVALWSPPLAWVVAGVLSALIGWLLLGGSPGAPSSDVEVVE